MLSRFQFILFLLFPFFLGSCRDVVDHRPIVTVSIEPLRYFVEAIGGDRFQVNTLVPAGASPETYELTPQQVVQTTDSRAYFCVGTLGFEQERLRKLTENAPNLLVVNSSDSIVLLEDNHVHDQQHQHIEGIDLHTWLSTTSGKQIARNVLRGLCQVDSANAAFYQQRHDSLVQHIDSLDGEIRQILRPLVHRTFMIYHPALGYFARDYGLQQIAVEQDGREPSADRMQQLILQAKHNNVQVVFIQEEHAGRAARRIAESTGARIVSIAPLSVAWDKQMLHIARTLVQSPQ
jgi:putative adhesion protein